MRVGFYGGSFDPPHRAHLRVAEAARDAFALDRVLLAPTGRQPFKPEGAGASFRDRLAMVELLCTGQVGLEASALDAPHADGAPNYTVDALRALRATLPGEAEVLAVVGADAFLHVGAWHRAPELFALAEWVVVSRPGFAVQVPPEHSGRVHVLRTVDDPTSATAVRDQLHTERACAEALPEAVCEYIRERGLYGV